jgi:cysteine synthase A
MFARNALRAASRPAFTTKSFRSASSLASTAESMNPHGIEISKAQRIAQDGFVSGMKTIPSQKHTKKLTIPPQQSVTPPSSA